MIPDTNWAPKLAPKSWSLRSANTAATSRWRPKTLTSPCPVKASSMWPFSSPVAFHCAVNSFCERLPITPVISTEIGMVTSAIRARTGETTNIITVTPMTVRSEVSSWLSVCCSDWATLSMSLVTRLSSSPRVCRSK